MSQFKNARDSDRRSFDLGLIAVLSTLSCLGLPFVACEDVCDLCVSNLLCWQWNSMLLSLGCDKINMIITEDYGHLGLESRRATDESWIERTTLCSILTLILPELSY